ncbi:MAG: DMT family transporter [Candidatus Aenigmatarchaeota archaeon]|nr:MAG: DMT family transporter [Candidatus Aenigmarchaeota archaeon]
MEPWLLLGVLAYLSYAISTSIDKRFMNRGYEPVSIQTFKDFFDCVILLIIGLLFFSLNFTFELFLWSLLLGFISAISGILYFTSLKLKDIEIVVPYLQSSTILLVFISSIILFSEIINPFNYIGLVLILIGVYAVLAKKGLGLPRLDRAILLISLLVVLTAAYLLLVKSLLFNIEPINLAISVYFSTTIILACYMLIFRRKQKGSFDIRNSKIAVSAIFGSMGTLFLFYALSLGFASRVYPVAGLQSVFVFIIASIFLRERFYWHRLAGTIIVFLGILFISL